MFNNENSQDNKGHIVFIHRKIRGFNKSFLLVFIIIILSFVFGVLGSLMFCNLYGPMNFKNVKEDRSKYDYDIINVINKLNHSIVSVSSYIKDEFGDGFKLIQNNITGIVYSEDGYIVTNFDGINNADKVYIKFPTALDTIKEAKVIGYDEEYDICLLKINGEGYIKGNFKKNLSDVSYGLRVISIGNSLGKLSSYYIYPGVVNGINLFKDDVNREVKFIRSDFNINMLNTGGPVCDVDGEILGMSSLKLDEKFSSVNYGSTYISSQDIIKIVQNIIKSATLT